jgi:hypothetical protein
VAPVQAASGGEGHLNCSGVAPLAVEFDIFFGLEA